MTDHDEHHFQQRLDAGEIAAEILANAKGVECRQMFAQYPQTFARFVQDAPESVRATLRRAVPFDRTAWKGAFDKDALFSYWSSYSSGPQPNYAKSMAACSRTQLAFVRAELAFQLACDHHTKQDLTDINFVHQLTGTPLSADIVTLLDKSARMWAGLRRLSESKGYSDRDRTSRLAIEDFVMRLVKDSPVLWAESLHIILTHADAIGDIVKAITITLAQRSDEVYSALKFIADHSDGLDLREHARGLLLLVEGAERPTPETVHRVLDQLARWAGSGVLFPHPLSPISATWLSSNETEKRLRSGLQLGLAEFKSDFIAQGVKNERALVQNLLTELAVPFRKDLPVVRGLGRFLPRHEPKIVLDHRTLVEKEETVYGPDVAFLVHARVHGSLALDIAEFVQVKKPKWVREQWANSWTIDVQQLKDLLNTSATAAYWLIDKDGLVLAVPAKYLRARMPVKAGKTFTIGFNEVRSAAIPVDQFLAELLVGTWLGSESATALKIARGEIPGLVPRHLIEVRVSLHGDEKN